MTKDKIKRLRNKIEDSRSRLMSNHPFFALLLMYVKFEAVTHMKRISTNGKSIYFNPSFIDKLNNDELDYILCHQIMHVINEDVWRSDDFAYSNYHYACDVKLNDILVDFGFSMERTSHLPKREIKIAGTGIETKIATTIELADSIIFNLEFMDEKTRNAFIVDSDEYWGKEEETAVLILNSVDGTYIDIFTKNISVIDGLEENQQGGDGEEKVKWRARAKTIAKSVSDTQNKNFSNIPDYVKRIIEGKTKPKLDWKKLLQEFIQESVMDYSFTPPDRRFCETDFFLPDLNEKTFVTKDILFMVDTSGSVTDRELSVVYAEISGALEQFKGKLFGKIGFFDTNVKQVYPMNNVSDLEKITPIGNGGTSFDCIFEYVENSYRYETPSCIIIFTDGYADWPDEKDANYIPVFWIINNEKSNPPWGKVARVINS